MRISDFDFELPDELIAQHPLERRDASRMLVVDRSRGTWRDASFADLPSELGEGDAVVVNNTRVFPARLVGRREPTGGRVELLLVRRRAEFEDETWEVLAKPARRLEAGARVTFGDGRLSAETVAATEDGAGRVVRFHSDGDFGALLEEFGRMPLPPYIKREAEDLVAAEEDRERYQTVYAAAPGAIAAPTAGLHFTPQVFGELRARGVRTAEVTLHVGYGTFAPVRADDLSEHRVAAERFEISERAAREVNGTRESGGRVVAVGTTTVRALESAADESGRVRA